MMKIMSMSPISNHQVNMKVNLISLLSQWEEDLIHTILVSMEFVWILIIKVSLSSMINVRRTT